MGMGGRVGVWVGVHMHACMHVCVRVCVFMCMCVPDSVYNLCVCTCVSFSQ